MLKALWITLFTLICNFSFAQGNPPEFESGITHDSTYINTSYNFQISIPKGWVLQKTDHIAAMAERGSDVVAGDNENLKAALKSSVKRTGYLLMASEFAVGAPVPANSTIAIMAEDVSAFPGIVTGADYLYHVKQLISQSKVNIEVKEITKSKIGSVDFGLMETSLVSPQGTPIKQLYYCTLTQGHAVSFLLVYATEKQYKVLKASIDSYKPLQK